MEELTLQVGVKILLRNKDGKYLLMKRNPEKYPDVRRRWDIPGGRINVGLSLKENLDREVNEEVSMKIIGEPVLIAAQDIVIPDKHIVRLTYIGETEGEPVLSEEHTEYQWLTVNELKELDGLGVYILELIEKGVLA